MSRAALLLSALLALPSAGPAQTTNGAQGAWIGTIEPADGDAVPVSITLQRTPAGFWVGALTAPVWEAEAVQLEAVSVSSDGVRFSATGLAGAPEFVGRLAADSSEIAGDVFRDPPPPPPATDIYLIELEIDGPFWKLGAPTNITDRDGYDNQPRFLPDASALLYTSIREGQADIYLYELASRRTLRLTVTGESEYSPTPLPSGDGFSTVRVEDDGTQRLWSFDPLGRQPMLVLNEIRPVGYHGWLDAHRVGLFVLGSPPTLEIAEVDRQTSRAVAENPGRSIHLTPDGEALSFVHKASATDWTIDRLEIGDGARRTLIATRDGSEDFIWAPDGRLVMGEGSGLFASSPDRADPTWELIADLGAHGITGITRLDISGDGRWLTVVGQRAPGPPPERLRSRFVLRRADPAADQ